MEEKRAEAINVGDEIIDGRDDWLVKSRSVESNGVIVLYLQRLSTEKSSKAVSAKSVVYNPGEMVWVVDTAEAIAQRRRKMASICGDVSIQNKYEREQEKRWGTGD